MSTETIRINSDDQFLLIDQTNSIHGIVDVKKISGEDLLSAIALFLNTKAELESMECQDEMFSEHSKMLGEIQHRMRKQFGAGKIKTIAGCENMINDQIHIMLRELEYKYNRLDGVSEDLNNGN